jgi:hypothetical protein
MFAITEPWHWVAVHGHNFIVEMHGLEKAIVRNRSEIEKDEQVVAGIACGAVSAFNPVLGLALMKVLPGFSAAFAKCLEALPKGDGDPTDAILSIKADADFVRYLKGAAQALEAQRPGSTTPPASLSPSAK